jgi:cysteine-rich repeat protein
MRRLRRFGHLSVLVVVACTDAKTVVDPNVTALEIVVEIDPAAGVDRLRISAVGEPPAFTAGTLPETPRPLSGEQTATVLLPDALDGSQLVVRADGLAGETLAASGGAMINVKAHEVQRVVITLGPPVICGDGAVADLLEQCDDVNTATGDGCTASCGVEPGWICSGSPSSCRLDTFDVVSAVALSNTSVRVTFSDPPDPAAALVLANYGVPGLALSGTPVVAGSTVTLTTSGQDPIDYNVVASNLTRARDGSALGTSLAVFNGRRRFDVESAASTGVTQLAVAFSEPPDATQATIATNYTIAGLAVTGTPTLLDRTVTLTTATQSAQSYTVTVTNVTRGADGEKLATNAAQFSGVNGFDVASAMPTSNREIAVTFNAPPKASQATNASNYTIPGLVVTGPVVLNGDTVTLQTSAQMAIPYIVTVANVTRASDAQPLTIAMGPFTGADLGPPTVTSIEVLSTSPNNGTTFFNTGTATVRLHGTQFASVVCPTGIKLDDRNGAGMLASTSPTSCTIDTDTQITATFPAGIQTNNGAGWNVLVTNTVGSNATSDKLVTESGLVVSEIYLGTAGHEFVELYNRTGAAINASALGLRLRVRTQTGMDSAKALTLIHATVMSHGFMLLVSSQSTAADPWFASRDATYTAGLVANGGVYLNLKPAKDQAVLDKVGWGTQPVDGAEGNPLADIPAGQSTERKPAGGLGHATDTDDNQLDFTAPSATITPRGTTDPPQP